MGDSKNKIDALPTGPAVTAHEPPLFHSITEAIDATLSSNCLASCARGGHLRRLLRRREPPAAIDVLRGDEFAATVVFLVCDSGLKCLRYGPLLRNAPQYRFNSTVSWHFASENYAGICPEARATMAEANDGAHACTFRNVPSITIPNWAELIVNVRTPLTDSISAYQHSRSERIEGVANHVIALE
jgi:hypothetical protein